jgi:hypothetical protein
MQAVTGVFLSKHDAIAAVEKLRAMNVVDERITLLTPGDERKEENLVSTDAGEAPGVGKALGAVVGAAGGLSGGSMLVAAMVPGIGMVTAAGLLGASILGAAGAAIGAAAGASLDNRFSEGLPEDEIFVYEDALRKGRSVVVVFSDDSSGAERVRDALKSARAEAIDDARHQWWIGLRSAEQEHYSAAGGNFGTDEKFYRLGFEEALHSRMRCKEFDQVSAEMESRLEELQKKYPGEDITEAYTRGYQRGREYYQRFCDQTKAA